MPRSISVSAPAVSRSIDLWSLRERSRTRRGNFSKITRMGIMRVSIIACCMPPEILSRLSNASDSPARTLSASSPRPRRSAIVLTRALACTSSATRLHSVSSFRVSTRIVVRSTAGCGPGSGAADAGAAGRLPRTSAASRRSTFTVPAPAAAAERFRSVARAREPHRDLRVRPVVRNVALRRPARRPTGPSGDRRPRCSRRPRAPRTEGTPGRTASAPRGPCSQVRR